MLPLRSLGAALAVAVAVPLATADLPASNASAPSSPAPPPLQRFVLTQNYLPHNLTDGFVFRKAADYPGTGDPTHGFVNYVDLATATARGLVRLVRGDRALGASFNAARHRYEQLYLGVDHTRVLSVNVTNSSAPVAASASASAPASAPARPAPAGRDSLRLESKRPFDRGLLVADFAHMPASQCGVWPAFWAYNFREDPVGELDILEGINHQRANMVSLHTSRACRFDAGWETGVDRRAECTVVYGNATTYGGCGITAPRPASYGSAFNRAGGGVYATLLESDRIRVWHWPRADVPPDLQRGRPDPEAWGQPLGDFAQANGGCSVGDNFHSLTVILNIDFCGDNQSDGVWSNDAVCARYPSCRAFVAAQPQAFTETYWLVNSIRLYEPAAPPPVQANSTNETAAGTASATAIAGPRVTAPVPTRVPPRLSGFASASVSASASAHHSSSWHSPASPPWPTQWPGPWPWPPRASTLRSTTRAATGTATASATAAHATPANPPGWWPPTWPPWRWPGAGDSWGDDGGGDDDSGEDDDDSGDWGF